MTHRRPQRGEGPIRVLELRSVRGTGGGPEKTILLGAAQSDPSRFAITVCYIRDRRDDVFAVTARAGTLPIDYVEIVEQHSLDYRIWKSIRQLVRDRRIRIVHAHEYKTDFLALALSRFERVIPVATAHGWTGDSWKERKIYYPADRHLLHRYPRVIAVSSEIKRALEAAGVSPSIIRVVLNGIDPAAFKRNPARQTEVRQALGLAPNALVVGAVGRTEPQKRFDILLDAFAELRRTRPQLRLVIAGDGSLRPSLEAQARRLEISPACLFLGQRSDIADLHHAFDLLVQSSEYEGTPNVVLEAMALGTPIVATDVGGTRELAEDGIHALVVRPGDEGALARAMANALDDREGSRRRAQAARERVEGPLSFENRMRTVERIYEDLIATNDP